jgi:hypothetical protein
MFAIAKERGLPLPLSAKVYAMPLKADNPLITKR